jgi:hypothetical protein
MGFPKRMHRLETSQWHMAEGRSARRSDCGEELRVEVETLTSAFVVSEAASVLLCCQSDSDLDRRARSPHLAVQFYHTVAQYQRYMGMAPLEQTAIALGGQV